MSRFILTIANIVSAILEFFANHFRAILAVIAALAFITSLFIIPARMRDNTPTIVTDSGHSLVAPDVPENATNVSITESTVIDMGASSGQRTSHVDYYIVLRDADGTESRVSISRSELGTISIGDTWYEFSYQMENQNYESERIGNFWLGVMSCLLFAALAVVAFELLAIVFTLLMTPLLSLAENLRNRY